MTDIVDAGRPVVGNIRATHGTAPSIEDSEAYLSHVIAYASLWQEKGPLPWKARGPYKTGTKDDRLFGSGKLVAKRSKGRAEREWDCDSIRRYDRFCVAQTGRRGSRVRIDVPRT